MNYTIAEAAMYLGKSRYFTEKKWQHKIVEDPATGKQVIPGSFLLEYLSKRKNLKDAYAVVAALERNAIFEIPGCPKDEFRCSKTSLVEFLPFFGGFVSTKKELERLIILGKWRILRNGNGTMHFNARDFMEPDTWASPAETCWREIPRILATLPEVELTDQIRDAHQAATAFSIILKEERTGLMQATSGMTKDEFLAQYNDAKDHIYRNREFWESPEFASRLPLNFKVIL